MYVMIFYITSRKPDFSGIWRQDSSSGSSSGGGGALSPISSCSSLSPPVSPTSAAKAAGGSLSHTHIISMFGSQIRIQEFRGALKVDDTTYSLLEEDGDRDGRGRPPVEQVEAAAASDRYVDAGHARRAYRACCFWLDDALTVHKVSVSDRSDLLIRREILATPTESEPQQMRLTAIQRNLVTGEEVESVSLFSEASSFSPRSGSMSIIARERAT